MILHRRTTQTCFKTLFEFRFFSAMLVAFLQRPFQNQRWFWDQGTLLWGCGHTFLALSLFPNVHKWFAEWLFFDSRFPLFTKLCVGIRFSGDACDLSLKAILTSKVILRPEDTSVGGVGKGFLLWVYSKMSENGLLSDFYLPQDFHFALNSL